MNRLFLLLAALFLASACTGSNATIPLHAQVAIDQAFSPEESEAVLAAAEQWRQATGMVSLDFVVSDAPEQADFAIVRRSGLNHYRGLTTQAASTVLIGIWPDDIYNSAGYEHGVLNAASVEEVALHELGHAFGLSHQSQGLMLPGSGKDAAGNLLPEPACIDSYTLSRFCELYSCQSTHPTCPQ